MIGGLFSRRAAIAAATGCSFLSTLGGVAPVAHAAEIKVMSTVALTPTLDELTPKYESSSGNNLMIVYSTIADLKKRIEASETADVMILSRAALDDLQTQGKVAHGSIVNVGSSYVAIGVRAGAPRPDISTVRSVLPCSSPKAWIQPSRIVLLGVKSRVRRTRANTSHPALGFLPSPTLPLQKRCLRRPLFP